MPCVQAIGALTDAVLHAESTVHRQSSLWSPEHAQCAQAKGAAAQGEAGVGQAADRGAGAAKDAAGQAKGAAKDAAGQVGRAWIAVNPVYEDTAWQVGCSTGVFAFESYVCILWQTGRV